MPGYVESDPLKRCGSEGLNLDQLLNSKRKAELNGLRAEGRQFWHWPHNGNKLLRRMRSVYILESFVLNVSTRAH